MYFTKLLTVAVVLGLMGCASSGTTLNSKREKLPIDDLVNTKEFIFNADMALPMMTYSMNSISNSGLFPPGSTASQIYISGGNNYIKVTRDSVMAELPYFGERQMGGGYNSREEAGIQFKGVAENLQIIQDKQDRYQVSFKMNKGSERFNVNMSLFQSGSASVTINSSQRFPIGYNGTISEVEKK